MSDTEPRAANFEHLDEAVRVLVGAGTIKQRLTEASMVHLSAVDPNALPRDLAGNFRDLMGMLNTAPAVGGLGAVEATIRKMSDRDAAGCAVRAFDLCVALAGREGLDAPAAISPRQLRLVGDE
ncbi:MAG: hypothetical protein U1F09_10770 [Steroidobacteraceae bacterium]